MRPALTRRFRLAPLLALLGVLVLPSPAARAAEYQVDPAHSTLLLRVWKEGPASVFAHDHVARATKFSGSLSYDRARPDASVVSVEAESASLVMDEPTYRRRFELPPIKEVNRREIQKTMRGPAQLEVDRFPKISFRSTRVESVGNGQLRVTGGLTLHGQTREVTFPATVEMRGAYLHAKTSFRFLQSDFGITPYSFGNAVANRDEVEMQIELLAK